MNEEDNVGIRFNDSEWHSIVSFNGNLYIDGAFDSGERIPEEEELALDMFLERIVREVVEKVIGKEVFIVE